MKTQGASAPARKLSPQEVRTFFVSAATWGRRRIFQIDRTAELILDVLRTNREKGRFAVHEFVIMPDHIHLLITPAVAESLEKCVQYIKGGFSFRAKRELGRAQEIWQAGYNEHRVQDANDYLSHVIYIRENPVRAHLVEKAEEYRFSSASGPWEVDPAPEQLRG